MPPFDKPGQISARTLMPLGLAMSLAYIVFIAGGQFEKAAAIDKLDLPTQLVLIKASLTQQEKDIQDIKRRLGLMYTDRRSSIDTTAPTSTPDRDMPAQPPARQPIR